MQYQRHTTLFRSMQMTKFITREVDDVSITSVEDIIIFFARNFGERQYYGFRLIRYDLIE